MRYLQKADFVQFGTNGVIHGVESIIIPPPTAIDIVTLLPGEFSTLELGLTKTGLIDALNDTSKHVGGTLFARKSLEHSARTGDELC